MDCRRSEAKRALIRIHESRDMSLEQIIRRALQARAA
jgi:hypothetical protein